MHGSEDIDVLDFTEKDRCTIAGRTENTSNKALRKRSHSLRRPVIRVFRRYTVILKPFIGKLPEQICNESSCEHSCRNGKNIIKNIIHNC